MHVQLSFRSKKEFEYCLTQGLDFTSQLSAIEPQGIQPSQEDERICLRYKKSKHVSPRWQFSRSKIHEDIKVITTSLISHIDENVGLYIYPDTGVVMAGKVIDYLLSVADE